MLSLTAAPAARPRRTSMDIVFLAAAVIAALFLPRNRALVATVAVWAICLAMVGWGPAHNSAVHTRQLGFWVPWIVVLLLGTGIVYGIGVVKQRRATRA
jgi:hypothetical protein